MRVVAIDVGNSTVKMTYDSPSGRGVEQAMFSSLVERFNFDILNEAELERISRDLVEASGSKYIVGESVRVQGKTENHAGLLEEWVTKPEYEALLRKAAREVGAKRNEPLFVVVGLPVVQFDRFKGHLQELTQNVFGDEAHVVVMQQPDALFFHALCDWSGQVTNETLLDEALTVILDIGYFTSDFVAYKGSRYVERAAWRGDGTFNAVTYVMNRMRQEGVRMSELEAEDFMLNGFFLRRGQKIKNDALIREAIESYANDLINSMERACGYYLDHMSKFLVSGGGAALLEPYLKKQYPMIEMIRSDKDDSPRFVVSEGYYRYGKMKQSKV